MEGMFHRDRLSIVRQSQKCDDKPHWRFLRLLALSQECRTLALFIVDQETSKISGDQASYLYK